MEPKRSWWIKEHWVPILIAIILIVAIVLITVEIKVYGTGFPGKTLWDWLQLLIIPVILVIAGFWLNQIQKGREQRITQQQADLEHKLTRDNQQETSLQAYIDKMSELLLKENLRESKPEDEVRKIARVRTLSVLSRLDPIRKRNVLQFLYESDLIKVNKSIIDLSGADLSGADLNGATLLGANLRNVNLYGANLRSAKLYDAALDGADLRFVDLTNAIIAEGQWKEAKSLEGAIMPDGSPFELDTRWSKNYMGSG